LVDARIAYSDKGINVDHHTATATPHICAAGDCAESSQLACVADAKAHVATANIFNVIRGGLGLINGHSTPNANGLWPIAIVLQTLAFKSVPWMKDALKARGHLPGRHL